MIDDADVDALGFEDAVQQLQQTVEELEGGALGLDDALAHYQRGVQLLRRCHGLLGGAERVVALLTDVDAEGNPQTAPFDASATLDREKTAEAGPASISIPLPDQAPADPDEEEDNDIPF